MLFAFCSHYVRVCSHNAIVKLFFKYVNNNIYYNFLLLQQQKYINFINRLANKKIVERDSYFCDFTIIFSFFYIYSHKKSSKPLIWSFRLQCFFDFLLSFWCVLTIYSHFMLVFVLYLL